MNCCFFLICPCVAMCNCFNPNADDDDDVTVWSRRVIVNEYRQEDDLHGSPCKFAGDDGGGGAGGGGAYGDYGSLINSTSPMLSATDADPLDEYNESDEERDTNFVLSVLNESRHSLKLLEGHCVNDGEDGDDKRGATTAGTRSTATRRTCQRPQPPPPPDPNTPKTPLSGAQMARAMTLVNRLLSAKLVYRTLREPKGGVKMAVAHQAYSVRGYFMPALGTGYQFMSHTPLRQYWQIEADVSVWNCWVEAKLVLQCNLKWFYFILNQMI